MERIIHHLHYTKWPDHGCPHGEQSFFEFMDLYTQLRYDSTTAMPVDGLKEEPVLVHCRFIFLFFFDNYCVEQFIFIFYNNRIKI